MSGNIYSPSLNGAFCPSCANFRPDNKPKGKLVNEPYINWKKATKQFDAQFFSTRHSSDVASSQKKSRTGYERHMLGLALEENFLKVMENKQSSVNIQLATILRDRTEKNI